MKMINWKTVSAALLICFALASIGYIGAFSKRVKSLEIRERSLAEIEARLKVVEADLQKQSAVFEEREKALNRLESEREKAFRVQRQQEAGLKQRQEELQLQEAALKQSQDELRSERSEMVDRITLQKNRAEQAAWELEQRRKQIAANEQALEAQISRQQEQQEQDRQDWNRQQQADDFDRKINSNRVDNAPGNANVVGGDVIGPELKNSRQRIRNTWTGESGTIRDTGSGVIYYTPDY